MQVMDQPTTSALGQKDDGAPPRPRLLIVEDNRGDVLLVEEAIKLHQVNVQLHVVEDGEQACTFIQQADEDAQAPCPDLLLLDLNLPKKTGLEVLQKVRESRRCRNIPVVIFTSSNSPQDRSETSRLGADRYFQKPTRYEQFLKIGQVLKEVLEQPQRR